MQILILIIYLVINSPLLSTLVLFNLLLPFIFLFLHYQNLIRQRYPSHKHILLFLIILTTNLQLKDKNMRMNRIILVLNCFHLKFFLLHLPINYSSFYYINNLTIFWIAYRKMMKIKIVKEIFMINSKKNKRIFLKFTNKIIYGWN